MKSRCIALSIALLIGGSSAMADEAPTCRWLHLDQDTRVYQCVVLASAPAEQDLASNAEALPDPTLPLAEQSVERPKSTGFVIPAYLQASLADHSDRGSSENTIVVAQPDLPAANVPVAIFQATTVPAATFQASIEEPEKPETPEVAAASTLTDDSMPKIVTNLAPQISETAVERGDDKLDLDSSDSGRFMVLAYGEVEQTKTRLIEYNERDYAFIRSSGRLSLGIYRSKKAAVQRKAALSNIGVESELIALDELKQIARSAVKIEMPVKPQLVSLSSSTDRSKPQQSKTVRGYLVATVGDQITILSKLKRLGETDFVALNTDPYPNRVSLGVYSSYENALARQNHFKSLGIDSELIARNESAVVRSTISTQKPREEPYGYDQIALRPLHL